MLKRVSQLLVVFLLVASCREAHADELDDRLTFLEDRIATQHAHAEIWWSGFYGLYSAGVIAQTARAFDADTRADRADLIISVVKSVGGVARFLATPNGNIEPFPVPDRALTLDEKRTLVAQGEHVLRDNAAATEMHLVWYAHVLNTAINAAGAFIVAFGFDDPVLGTTSGLIGTAVGELSFFTAPWEADNDLVEYQQRFQGAPVSAASPPPFRLQLTPQAMGAGIRIDF